MIERLIIAGAGGQGIMLLGKVLAQAAMQEHKFVTWFPCYGAEVRGGTAYCMVVIADEEIASPYIEQADALIIMNEPSLIKFKQRIKPGGLLLVNASLASARLKKDRCLNYPFTDIAVKLGNIKVANMVALGCYISHKNIVQEKSILQAISGMAPADKKDLIEINQKALKEGMKLK